MTEDREEVREAKFPKGTSFSSIPDASVPNENSNLD